MVEQTQQHNILYSCVGESKLEHDPFVYEHALALSLSGTAEFYSGNKMLSFPEGSLCFVKRNQLLNILKKPANGKPFASVTIILSQEILKKYFDEREVKTHGLYIGDNILKLENDAFMSGYFNSLMPYFAEPDKLTPTLAQSKTTEVIELLLRNPVMKELLFDFREPYKIDLQSYMEQNFYYNVPLSQFAKLTGRSLSTFKRDFAKLYHITPEKWLQNRRLEQAYFLISQKSKKPSDIYLELGFESLSHFSFSFKKQFGCTPSELRKYEN